MLEDMEQQPSTATTDYDEATKASSLVVQAPPDVPETVSPSLRDLVSDVGALRTETRLISSDVDETNSNVARLHRDVRVERLAESARSVAKRAPNAVLVELSDRGFSWRDIARMVGVSVPAIKKWRRGEQPSGENRYKLAELGALCEILDEEVLIEDLATWFEIPIAPSRSITPIDLVASGRSDLVQEHAHENEAPADLLDDFDPTWRESDAGDFETVRAGDGQLTIRSKGIDP